MEFSDILDELEAIGEPICIGERMELRGPVVCGPIKARGLCTSCYNMAKREGMLELIALPPARRGPKPRNAA